jgi:hypothetical protein
MRWLHSCLQLPARFSDAADCLCDGMPDVQHTQLAVRRPCRVQSGLQGACTAFIRAACRSSTARILLCTQQPQLLLHLVDKARPPYMQLVCSAVCAARVSGDAAAAACCGGTSSQGRPHLCSNWSSNTRGKAYARVSIKPRQLLWLWMCYMHSAVASASSSLKHIQYSWSVTNCTASMLGPADAAAGSKAAVKAAFKRVCWAAFAPQTRQPAGQPAQ